MKARILYLIAAALCLCSCGTAKKNVVDVTKYPNRAEMIVAQMHDPDSKYVVVACHRGDWRNYPENSIPAIESIIRMGADIMELDLKLTKDSVLVLSHDRTIDRCTTGKGLVSDYTLDELKKFRLRRAHGVATDSLHICTLREALECCKDRICVNVDHGSSPSKAALASRSRIYSLNITGHSSQGGCLCCLPVSDRFDRLSNRRFHDYNRL